MRYYVTYEVMIGNISEIIEKRTRINLLSDDDVRHQLTELLRVTEPATVVMDYELEVEINEGGDCDVFF